MAGVIGVRNIAAAAGVDPREVIAMLHSGSDMRWLACRAIASLVEERRVAKEVDISGFIRAATEIH